MSEELTGITPVPAVLEADLARHADWLESLAAVLDEGRPLDRAQCERALRSLLKVLRGGA